MELYKKLYFTLFGQVENALVLLDDKKTEEAKETLLGALNDAEETYITANEAPAEEAMLSEMMSQFLKTLHRLDKSERPAAIRMLEQSPENTTPVSAPETRIN